LDIDETTHLTVLDDDKHGRIVNRVQSHQFTPNTIMNKEGLIQEIKKMCKRGYSLDNISGPDRTISSKCDVISPGEFTTVGIP
jgi:DNA-binding IclR family transcriptional regulator